MTIRPENILPDDQNYAIIKGIKVRKGTIAAVLQNAGILASSSSGKIDKERAKEMIVKLAPGLVVLGMCDHVTWKIQKLKRLLKMLERYFNEAI